MELTKEEKEEYEKILTDHKLMDVFHRYSKDEEMSQSKFLKVFQNSKLIDSKLLTTTRVDIIFNNVKTKGKMKIDFQQFLEGIIESCHAKKVELKSMISEIAQLKDPQYKGTKPKPNKLHDDKKNYTGVYKNGGPTNVDSDKDRTVEIGYLYKKDQENVDKN